MLLETWDLQCKFDGSNMNGIQTLNYKVWNWLNWVIIQLFDSFEKSYLDLTHKHLLDLKSLELLSLGAKVYKKVYNTVMLRSLSAKVHSKV